VIVSAGGVPPEKVAVHAEDAIRLPLVAEIVHVLYPGLVVVQSEVGESGQATFPVTPTVAPRAAVAGIRDIVFVGTPLTTKVASAASPAVLPTIVIV
jgi:hypothetical protein